MIPDPPLTVAVHGLGHVGAVNAACLADQGHRVTGIDVDRSKVDQINEGLPSVSEPGLASIVGRVASTGRLTGRVHEPELAAELLETVDVHLVCVGTPSSVNGSPDASAVVTVIESIAAALASSERHRYPVVIVRSTVLPGTVDGIARSIEERFGVRHGVDFGLAMCPEFLREASAVGDFLDPPFTVAGVSDARSEHLVNRLFAFTGRPVHSVTVATAEMIKYACNAFHALKVVFANEIGRISQASGAHGLSVMDILCRDERLNISDAYLRPGFAFGGSCLPKDLRALAHHSRRLDLDVPLLESVLRSNDEHVRHTTRLIESFRPRRVCVLGLTFKPGTDDLRESPYVRVAEWLLGRGCEVAIWDPDLDPDRLKGANQAYIERRLPHLARLVCSSPAEALADSDVALLGTVGDEILAELGRRPQITVIDAEGSLSVELRGRSADYQGVAW